MLLVLQLNVWPWLTWSQKKSEKKSGWRDQLLEKLIEEISNYPFLTLLVISSNLYRVTKKPTQRLHVMHALHLPVDSIKWVSYACLDCYLGLIFIEMEECTIISRFYFLECVVMATDTTAIIGHEDKALHLEENRKKKDLGHKVNPSQPLPGFLFNLLLHAFQPSPADLVDHLFLSLQKHKGCFWVNLDQVSEPNIRSRPPLLVPGSLDSKSKETLS